jgi:hypothetical protein
MLQPPWKFPKKLNTELPYMTQKFSLGYISKKNENQPHKNLCMDVHSRIHNSGKEIT